MAASRRQNSHHTISGNILLFRAILKNAQRALGEVMQGKEVTAAGKKRKQAVVHELLTPCAKTSAVLSLKGSQCH